MNITLQLWHLILLLLAFFSCVWAFGAVLLRLFEKSLDQRFTAQDARFKGLEDANKSEANAVARVEREVLELKAELPREYVRREDWIRFSGVIDSKLDAVAARIELLGERIR